MNRHPFDAISFVLGAAFAGLGLFFLIGDRTATDIGWKWMWPVAVVVVGLLFVISAIRRLTPAARRAGPPEDEPPP